LLELLLLLAFATVAFSACENNFPVFVWLTLADHVSQHQHHSANALASPTALSYSSLASSLAVQGRNLRAKMAVS